MRHVRTRRVEFVGGALCLDFANTVGGLRDTWHEREYLIDFEDLVSWSRQAGLLTVEEVERLLGASAAVAATTAVFARAIALREAIYRICTALLAGNAPEGVDLRTLDAESAVAQAHMRLRWADGSIGWEWASGAAAPDAMLWHVARSATELLTSPMSHALGQCSGESCGWLFLDTTKNHS